ncbi:hypothetical protein F4780DRAFT_767260 [Xylariomycetidae sp. FL0641]|nr:hypothetical protein F4780DRAFT_767260 [Xylariomycetidae sp. FL0641]
MKSAAKIVLGALVASSTTYATPVVQQRQDGCTDPAIRKEWRALTDDNKAEYISAVQCLATKPSKLGLDSTLYDDFPYIHMTLNLDIHFVASFLPWHRYFVHLYETALRDDCGYEGVMPYWDWTKDSGALPSSPIFSPSATTGFGGSGEGAAWIPPTHVNPLTACVTDGAFTGLNLSYFTSGARPHCLNRVLNNGTGIDTGTGTGGADLGPWLGNAYSPATVANITDSNTRFDAFWPELENTPHGSIHSALGGDMLPQTSPNDPLFFMHHSQVDRLWWQWQQVDPSARNSDFAGNRFMAPDETPAALTDAMTYLGFVANITVAEVMTTENQVLCYRYE